MRLRRVFIEAWKDYLDLATKFIPLFVQKSLFRKKTWLIAAAVLLIEACGAVVFWRLFLSP